MDKFRPASVFDFVNQFSSGMNSDVPPILLDKSQLAFATSVTCRGGFATHRAAFNNFEFSYNDPSLQPLAEERLFQGAGFYKSDNGQGYLITIVGGKFFRITPSKNTALVEDISADTDNSDIVPIQWLWQGENFMFLTDGQSAPAIYDGTKTFRANQGEVIATIANTWTVPSPGASASVTFAAPFDGPFNTPLYAYSGSFLLGTFEVNAENAGTGYRAQLTNIDDTPGNLQATDSEINIVNSWSGQSVTAGTPPTYNDTFWGSRNTMQQNGQPGAGASPEYQRQTVVLTPPFTGAVGSRIIWSALNREKIGFRPLETIVISINNTTGEVKVDRDDGPSSNNVDYVAIPSGSPASLMNGSPDVLVAITTAPFNAPAVNAIIIVTVDRAVTVSNQVVYINGSRYRISPAPPVSSTSLYLKSISPVQSGKFVSANAVLRTIPQLPPCRMGVYGMGRNWVSLQDNQSYVASDLVGSSSGSIAYDYRDAILNITENNYLAGGGKFRVPGAGLQINAFAFPATLDSSLGQGALQVFTQSIVFSCNAPIDRLTWQDLTNPIQTQSLVGGGTVSQRPPLIINGDLWFRSITGIRSLKLARQDFTVSYSNTPQSVEMSRVIDNDNQNLLQFFNGVNFDNRALMTASPVQAKNGVYHTSIIALNLDPNSSLRGKQAPIYDGVWEGLNVLQLVTGFFEGIERCFAFTYDKTTDKIGLTEILKSSSLNSTNDNFDNGSTPIEWSFEMPVVFSEGIQATPQRQLLRLVDGEIMVEDVQGAVDFAIYFRPDYDPEWHLWYQWSVGASPKWQPRMGLGEPTNESDPTTNRPYRVGYNFQCKAVITGHCRFMGMNLQCVTEPTQEFAPPMTNE